MLYQLNERHCTICGATVRFLGKIEDELETEVGRKLGCPNHCFYYEINRGISTVVLTLRPSKGAYRIKFQGHPEDDERAKKLLKESIGRVEKIARRLYWEFGHGDVKLDKQPLPKA